MNTKTIAAGIAGAFLCIGPAVAQDNEEADAVATSSSTQESLKTASVERKDERVSCRDLAPKAGTRIPGRRVCLPQYKWDEWDETTRETARDIEMRGRIRNN